MNKKALFFSLYFFEGAPIGLIWWTIPTILSTHGVSVDIITTLLAVATLPWTVKFLLGPFVDRYLSKNKHFALLIATFQIGMLLCLATLLFLTVDSKWLSYIIISLSAFSAIQDVVIDAWAIASVDKSDRGKVNGAMQAGMLSGKWFFGPGLLIALSWLNWKIAVSGLLVLIMISITSLVLKFRNNNQQVAPIVNELGFNSLSFIFTKKFLFLAAVALLSAFSLESITNIGPPLLVKQGFDQSQIGWILSGTLFLMLGGSILGGKLSDSKGAKKVFLLSGIALVPTTIAIGAFDLLSTKMSLISFIYISYILVGIFISSSYTFYMNHSHGKMEATKFTFLMAITNLCESSAVYATGQLAVEPGSYFRAFVFCGIISLIGLALLIKSPKTIVHE